MGFDLSLFMALWGVVMATTAMYDVTVHRSVYFLHTKVGVSPVMAMTLGMAMYMLPPLYIAGTVYLSLKYGRKS